MLGQYKFISLEESKRFLQNGDVLLFRDVGWVSWLVRLITGSPYSHAGLLAETDGGWYCIDFSLNGCKEHKLQDYVAESDGLVDVYRPSERIQLVEYDPESKQLVKRWISYPEERVITTMRSMIGLPYGFKRAWWMLRFYLAFVRLLHTPKNPDDDRPKKTNRLQVCSTSVAACGSLNGYDFVRNRADAKTSPDDLSTSAALNYLFTLTKD